MLAKNAALMRAALVLLVALVLAGCGEGVAGVYHAEVEQVGTPSRPQVGYSLEEYRQKLAQAPRSIELLSSGRFVTREGDHVIWEGDWHRDGDHLVLRAKVVRGVAVLEKLQDDNRYPFRAGVILDENLTRTHGLRLAYRKR